MQTIQSIARRRWNGDPGPSTTRSEPIEDPLALEMKPLFVRGYFGEWAG